MPQKGDNGQFIHALVVFYIFTYFFHPQRCAAEYILFVNQDFKELLNGFFSRILIPFKGEMIRILFGEIMSKLLSALAILSSCILQMIKLFAFLLFYWSGHE